jgi:tetraacyldisaccharide 4'-kinase
LKPIDAYWDSLNPVSILLYPLSWLFRGLALLRRSFYRLGLFKSVRLPVPVIVIGNISVGGTGKTPLVLYLAQALAKQGFKPGIITRGYGSDESGPREVDPDGETAVYGDEPLLLARRSGCPVWVGRNRPEAARALLTHSDCDLLISDDGLQHYALQRDIEIAVVDGDRGFGNGFHLPAGPLREGKSRLKEVDLMVVQGSFDGAGYPMHLQIGAVVSLSDNSLRKDMSSFSGDQVHAMAGIGNPTRFFRSLRDHGINIIEHRFPDHHRFVAHEICPADDLAVIMTEKDAVKCRRFSQPRHWYVEVAAKLDEKFMLRLNELLRGFSNG